MTLSFLYGLLFLATWRILRLTPPADLSADARRRWLWPVAIIAIVIAGSVAELLHPRLEQAWERSAAAIDRGELWRLVTSYLVQGGGVWGMAFNLITLVITALLAAQVFGRALGPAVWVVGGTVGNLLALTLGFPDGAGSSLATMTLAVAAAVTAAPLVTRSGRFALGVLAVVGPALVVLRDEHAIAVVLGGILGIVLLVSRRPRRQVPRPAR
ncbi:rhomboid family intramembrane serine protease [Tsukamurella sputi]|uniref:Rhomboid family intramembrane serine protease n=1 Tax=Tsukamurella sputi TaxID=2591848 RepID=A0A5C5RLG7_9ACTN|nr:rhomboid family intramembrane serine protease [Tsukamurella sputi]TWS23502.1 rhomboid family intramembrane serine protease [Tsukamurella sputi]